jgi:hypothetical protein
MDDHRNMARRSRRCLAAVVSAIAAPSFALIAAAQGGSPVSWLDQPLVSWNKPGDAVPSPPRSDESTGSVIKRCQLTPPRQTDAERALEAAGWVPFWNVDQQLVRDDVEVVGGMAAADGMCRPARYNLFVFVGGKFAGVLSPTSMTSRLVRRGPHGAAARYRRIRPLPVRRSALLPLVARHRPLPDRSHAERSCRHAG